MAKFFTVMAGGAALLFGLCALFGWLTALAWNHFEFLNALHHMSAWDGVVMNVLCSLLFKTASVSTK